MYPSWYNRKYATCAQRGGVNTVSGTFSDGTAKWQAIGLLYASVQETVNNLDVKNVAHIYTGMTNFSITHEAVNGKEYLYLTATIPLPSGYNRSQCKYILTGNVGFSFAYSGKTYNEVCSIPDNLNNSAQNNGVVKVLAWSESSRDATVNYKVTSNNAYYFLFAKK